MPPTESGQPLRLRNCSQNRISFRFTRNKHDSRFPIGLLFRLVRRDALKRRMDRTRVSHWHPKHEVNDVASYYLRY